MKVLIAGGTGFIGSALVSGLKDRGHEVLLLSRREESGTEPALNYLKWDGRSLGAWAGEMETVDAVINLAGEPIARKRWTLEQKEKIVRSRIQATRILVEAMEKAEKKPRVLINASAAGYYGNVPEGDVTEIHPGGAGFLAGTCEQWEKEALLAEKMGVRTVLLRNGIVLEKEGGALRKMIPPFRFFVGGPLGTGRQWFPWIHRADVVGIILFALENDAVSGPVNTTAPHPVRMYEFCHAMGKALKRPSWLPVPGFVLKCLLGEMSEMLESGQKAVPQKLLREHYVFKFPALEDALRDIFSKT